MNSITGREPRADTRDINQPKESQTRTLKGPGTGYYLALTFGTLLSSQRADAQDLHPRGLRSRRLLVVAPHNDPPPQERPAGPRRGLARRREKVTWVGGAVSNGLARDAGHPPGIRPTSPGHTTGDHLRPCAGPPR